MPFDSREAMVNLGNWCVSLAVGGSRAGLLDLSVKTAIRKGGHHLHFTR